MGLRDILTRTGKRGLPAGEFVVEGAIERVEPLEGTNISLFNNAIPAFWAENGLSSSATWMPGGAQLAERVWVANRCQQLNSQQLSSMPLKFHGPEGAEPAWMSNPDPNWYPNGVGDALFSIVSQLYGWGFSCQYVTDFYSDGFPRTWTVLPSSAVQITMENGARQYKLGDDVLNPRRVVQIDRNPGTGLHGYSALQAYAQNAWGLLAAGNQSMTVNQGGIPAAVLKSQTRKLTREQAEAIQSQWMAATQRRNGAPPVLPPDLEFQVLGINPSDLSLLETQEWNSRVLATAYGVPAVLLNMSLQGGLTYQNPLALMQMWWLTELRTTAKRIGDAFSAQMLPRGQWISFDASDITTENITPDDDEQAAVDGMQPNPKPSIPPAGKATPASQPQPLTAIGGGG